MSAVTPERTLPAPWAAPHVAGPVSGRVAMPGSKSATNRALLLAALSPGSSRLLAPLRARDTLLMAEALRRLGAGVADAAADWVVEGRAEPADVGAVTADVGNAGTAARFLPPAAAVLARGTVTIDGDDRMRERPLGPLLDAMRALGAGLAASAERIPFTLQATGRLGGGTLEVDASSSSQLISGLLLAAPRYESGLVVSAAGGRVPSAPHLAMTVGMLREAGASVDDSEPGRWIVSAGGLRATTYAIEPDLSSASAFLAAAAITGGSVRLADWPAGTAQPGRLLPELLAAFGCRCEITAAGELEVSGPDLLHGVDLDLSDYGEAVPTLTAIALFADTPSRLRGIAHLRGQETDRLAALAEEFGRLGAGITVTSDGLQITPTPLAAGGEVVLDPRADHRLAMAYAVAGLRVPGVLVSDIATTGKTMPDFPQRWAQLLAGAC
ncbi:MAG TPA: 3-phosphoshikimate 1-carboxyvinyltransferase [Frankiaceae bacterium]|nr:3-phosphoshikimate 1-carboxyvinyltransferase [Frankiaceae bacterium]